MSRFDYRAPGEDPAYCDALAAEDEVDGEADDMGPQPKPPTRLQERAEVKLDRLSRTRRFRAAVWARDEGRCQYCGRRVLRTIELDPLRGEVHHLMGRRVAPQDRWNVDRAVLLCLTHHQQAQRHEIVLVAPSSSSSDE